MNSLFLGVPGTSSPGCSSSGHRSQTDENHNSEGLNIGLATYKREQFYP